MIIRRKKAAEERKRKGEDMVKNLQEAKKLLSGILVSNRIDSLNDPRFLKVYKEKKKN